MSLNTVQPDSTLTPMMRQYRKIKEGIPDSILLFRLGDFYEMFFDDAKKASSVLNIALTARGNKVPMCGVPYHAAEAYIAKLIKNGNKVAVCDQVEDAKLAKGIVKRDVTRVITPGTVLDSNLLTDKSNNFLASIYRKEENWGLSYVDIATGEFRATEPSDSRDLLTELIRIRPSEIIVPSSFADDKDLIEKITNVIKPLVNYVDDWQFDYESCEKTLKDQFKVASLDGFGLRSHSCGIKASGAVLTYLKDNLYKSLRHLKPIAFYSNSSYMVLDAVSQRNLEIVSTLKDDKKEGSLLDVVDKTVTPMGGRMIRNWFLSPLINIDDIKHRHTGIEGLLNSKSTVYKINEILHEIKDLERIIGRLNCTAGNPRDLLALKGSLKAVPDLRSTISELKNTFFEALISDLDELKDVAQVIEETIKDDAPITIREGNIIKDGYDKELDEIRSIYKSGRGWIAELQTREAARTGVKSLKVRYNKVFGYYIEISNSNLQSVPPDYIRKQTLVNSERFITEELKNYESKVLGAQERANGLEGELFSRIKEKVVAETKRIQRLSNALATLDTINSMAMVASSNNYVMPQINSSDVLHIKGGRHPVIERLVGENKFVPNDVLLDPADNQLLIITGPNMAGKSTYIRQVALIVLMAQAGCYVPAEDAVIGIVDRIFTRVGASDDISSGQSTFMVEMTETANIINNATNKSLVILDEIGRGTSTFDGLAIAWSVCEYLHNNKSKSARTLFATHYHELTELEMTMSGVKNYNVAVREWNDEVIFLHKIIKGGTDKSYGIHVAKLAGLPDEIIKRALEILDNLEEESLSDGGKPAIARKKENKYAQAGDQLLLFNQKQNRLIEELKDIDMNNMTPIQALNKLIELKKKL